MQKREEKPWMQRLRIMLAGLMSLLLVGMAFPVGTALAAEAEPSDGRKMLVPVGHTVGIKLFSQGVMVVGLTDVVTETGELSPAKECGLRQGDIITHIDAQPVDTIEEVQAALQETGGEEVELSISRQGRNLKAQTTAALSNKDGSYRLGAWIRDSMAGIGTVTYYDPNTGKFAALGHGINDIDTHLLIPLQSGGVMKSIVADVRAGEKGKPGELHGQFDLNRDLGSLYANTDQGVFGKLDGDVFGGKPIPVAKPEEVKVGKATIRCNVSGDQVEEFEVEILRVYPNTPGNDRSMMIEVTDPKLLEKTGGVVQGMSGSPIIQDGKLIGAVTHVLVNDPTKGYGIFIDNMLASAA